MERKKSKTLTILALGLVFMIVLTVLAFQVLFWLQSDLSVDIVSGSDEDCNEVVFSVQNTAGSTLLFYENADMTGKIEYLSEDGWVEYCDVTYTYKNSGALSQQYGGVFAELSPGESWDVVIPEDKVEGMENGTYRVVFTYITASNYKDYLDDAFDDRNDESEASGTESASIENSTEASDVSVEEEDEEKFLAESRSKVFIKIFDYVSSTNTTSTTTDESDQGPITIRPETH